MKKVYKQISMLLVLCMVVSMIPVAVAAGTLPFIDVNRIDWFYDSVEYVYEEGLMSGTGENTFSPNGTTTRGMIVTILHRLEGEPVAYGASFADVADGAYYADAVAWASDKGIVSGYGNDNFGPNDAITRQQLAAILFRFADLRGRDTKPRAVLGDFVDAESVADYAVDAMQWAAAQDLIKGSDGCLNPYGFATRAQVAAILERFCNVGGDEILLHEFLFGHNDDGKEPYDYYVAFELLIDDVIDNLEEFETYGVTKGEKLEKPVSPNSKVAKFEGWYTSLDYTTEVIYGEEIKDDIVLYAKWSIDDMDTDADGLYDVFEKYLSTDSEDKDTDADRLSDYDEIEIGTNPNNRDSDNDGITDFDEDLDEDGISNGIELQMRLLPYASDTDLDGLSDGKEVNDYKTDPKLLDTDGDGADDGWEVRYNFDPIHYDSSFDVMIEPVDPNEAVGVTAGVQVNVAGTSISSLQVTPVEDTESNFLTPFIAGYMGPAYDFSVDGAFDEATITFRYNTEMGMIGEEFQPRIYYFNEETKMLEELKNQTVEDGCISVKVSHFSKYILLNKVAFDAVWETEIRPPFFGGEGSNEDASLDIVFVIDYSASMDWNDPNHLFKELSKEFVTKLRDDKDHAAVVKFIRKATLVSSLTTDKDVLNSAIDSISYDSGYNTYSGTDGSTGLRLAIDELAGAESEYQYIIFVTDGEDNQYTYSYDALIEDAAGNNIVIYTIGMGSASESTLKKIANGTNGKYYHATTNDVDADDILNLGDVFEEIESETIDLTADSNDDGIPDYYNDLIARGELVLSDGSTELSFIDFNYDADGNPSMDFDGDGVKNGGEVRFKQTTGADGETRVYMYMDSHPLRKHSDGDGVSDGDEVAAKTDPLRAEYNFETVDSLINEYTLAQRSIELIDSTDKDLVDWVLIAMVGSKEKLYRQLFVEYFDKYYDEDYNTEMVEETKSEAVAVLWQVLSKLQSCDRNDESFDYIKSMSDVQELISELNKASTYSELGNILDGRMTSVLVGLEDAVDLGQISVTADQLSNATIKGVGAYNANAAKMAKDFDMITILSFASEIGKSIRDIALININNKTIENNADLLRRIALCSEDEFARAAAQNVYDTLMEEYAKILGDEVQWLLVNEGLAAVVDYLIGNNPYVIILKGAVTITDSLFGLTKDVEQSYKMRAYQEIYEAAGELAVGLAKVSSQDTYYFVEEKNVAAFERYLHNSAQSRVLSDVAYYEYNRGDGLVTMFSPMDDWFKDNAAESFGETQELAIELGISLSPELLWFAAQKLFD